MNPLLQRLFASPSAEPADTPAAVPSATAGLDVRAALGRHLSLRRRLLSCANGQCDPSLNAEDLFFDNRCMLGQWLHGPAQAQWGQHRGFTDLLEQHRMFHAAASNVVALARAGRLAQSQDMAHRQLEAFSNGVLRRLNAMKEWEERRAQRRAQHPTQARFKSARNGK